LVIARNRVSFRKHWDGLLGECYRLGFDPYAGDLDIMRTILQTAMAAEVDPAAYLKWVLKMPKESIDAEPQGFTPRAYAAWLASQVRHDSSTAK
jgi:hypothetical protein